jgi:hypothetical protein
LTIGRTGSERRVKAILPTKILGPIGRVADAGSTRRERRPPTSIGRAIPAAVLATRTRKAPARSRRAPGSLDFFSPIKFQCQQAMLALLPRSFRAAVFQRAQACRFILTVN